MTNQGVYYLARLSKMGTLTTEMVIQALLNPTPIVRYGNAWSFVNTKEYTKDNIRYVAGRLVKYRPDAEVIIVDPPLGPLWKPLRDYIKERRSGQMVVREDSKSKKSLNTKLPEIVEAVANQPEGHPYIPREELPIGDAAVLMAADGYGTGHIKGERAGSVVVIRTADTSRNFTFDKDPKMEELFIEALHIFESIHNKRHMEHD